MLGTIPSSTDDKLSPRQEGEAVAKPRLRQIRDGAGVGRRAREQLDTFVDTFPTRDKVVTIAIPAHHNLPWYKFLLITS